MKKILLATTMLTLTAGAAAADGHITWGGSATAGIANEGATDAVAAVAATGTRGEIRAATAAVTAAAAAYAAAPTAANLAAYDAAAAALDAIDGSAAVAAAGAGPFETYSSVNLAVTFAGQTDGGLTFGATFDMTAGRTYALADDDGFADEGGSFGMPTVFVSGSFGKLAISDDNYDFYDDANGGGDAEYTGTFGAFSVGLIADIDANEASAKVGYTAGNIAVNANMDTYELWNLDATYTMGAIAVTAATNEAEESSLKVAYTGANGISGSAKYNSSDESIDLVAGYSANGLTVGAELNTESENWTVTAEYDLGGGLVVEAGTNYTEDMMIGAKMAF